MFCLQLCLAPRMELGSQTTRLRRLSLYAWELRWRRPTFAGVARVWTPSEITCCLGVGRIARHQLVNKAIRNALAESGCVPTREPTGLLPDDLRRPDGITALPFDGGRPLVWDAPIVHTCAPNHFNGTAVLLRPLLPAPRIMKNPMAVSHLSHNTNDRR